MEISSSLSRIPASCRISAPPESHDSDRHIGLGRDKRSPDKRGRVAGPHRSGPVQDSALAPMAWQVAQLPLPSIDGLARTASPGCLRSPDGPSASRSRPSSRPRHRWRERWAFRFPEFRCGRANSSLRSRRGGNAGREVGAAAALAVCAMAIRAMRLEQRTAFLCALRRVESIDSLLRPERQCERERASHSQ